MRIAKVTVLYNLLEGQDVEAFLQWRTTAHQEMNEKMPGVIRTDFYVARDVNGKPPLFRYITEVYYESMAEIERHFLQPDVQEGIERDIATWKLCDFVTIVSEKTLADPNWAN